MKISAKKILACGFLVGIALVFAGAGISAAELPITENPPTQNPPTTQNNTIKLNVPIPGLEGDVNLPNYIKAVYKFGIGVLALLAMGMIMIGGYEYMFSAGDNITKTGDAKARIRNALIGLFIALTSFLLLNTINPDLLKPVPDLTATEIKKTSEIPHSQKLGQYCNQEIGPDCIENLVCDKWEKSPIGICGEEFLGSSDVKIINPANLKKEQFFWGDCSSSVPDNYCTDTGNKKPTGKDSEDQKYIDLYYKCCRSENY